MSRRGLVVVDIEASGLRAHDVTVEMAWWALSTGERGRFVPAHDPQWVAEYGQPDAQELNGYHRRGLDDPSGHDDGTELRRLHLALRGQRLAGCNPLFDARHLSRLFVDVGLFWWPWHQPVDVSTLAVGVLGLDPMTSPSLAVLCDLLNVDPGDHTAEADVTATGRCFLALAERAGHPIVRADTADAAASRTSPAEGPDGSKSPSGAAT